MPAITRRAALGASLGAVAFGRRAAAQGAWPNRPVRIIVPFSAAGTTDIVARILVEPLSARLGQAVVVENRPGAGGDIGAEAVAVLPAATLGLEMCLGEHNFTDACHLTLDAAPPCERLVSSLSREIRAAAALSKPWWKLDVRQIAGLEVDEDEARIAAEPISRATFLAALRDEDLFLRVRNVLSLQLLKKGRPE